MSLRTRLFRLQGQSGSSVEQPAESASDLRRRLAGIVGRYPPTTCRESNPAIRDKALAQALKGYTIGDGLIRISRRIPLQGALGRLPLSRLTRPPILPGERAQALRRQVYIDTETTGLSGGSGTLAFLIGMACVEDDAILINQYMITRFTAEGAMLDAFSAALNAEDRLVSYNGKCYDLPLLKSRYRMQGRTVSLHTLPHLDLLHPVRRLFSTTWPDCRLLTLEQRLLGLQRHNDLPGSAAPEAWFDFVRSGIGTRLIRVVEHNRQDLLSLAMAHSALTQVIAQPRQHGADIVALARWLTDSDEKAAHALLKEEFHKLPQRGKKLLGRLARRLCDWELALQIWEELALKGCHNSAEQLAKYHEHISKDLEIAKRYCKQLPDDGERQRRMRRIDSKLLRRRIQPELRQQTDSL
ncbi:MAG: ribonuclease H-like domain-containing protein [Candidatus Thiodiazotropha sp.]